jgi:hypothetical protein
MDHPYRRNKKYFDGTVDRCKPPNYRDRPKILRELNKLEVVLGKGDGARAARDEEHLERKISLLETTLLASVVCMALS